MKQYEAVREIFNLCSGNQMRDVFFQEIQTDDLDAFVKAAYEDEKDFHFEKSVAADGSIIYDIMTAQIRQRYTFTEIS